MRGGGLHFDPEWRDALARAGLTREALAHGDVGVVVQRKPGREVRRVEAGGERPALYVKRIRVAGLRNRLEALLGRDPATREARELQRVAIAGVRAARPIAYGRVGRGLCLIATEEVRGRELTSALAAAPPRERRRLLRAAGELLGKLHGSKIFHEVRGKDVIVADDGALTLIDRDPKDALPGLAREAHGALLCLARCEYLRLRGGAKLSERERAYVLDSYCRASRYTFEAALPIVCRALERELARHRANPSLTAEFGPLSP
jgi:hypothetical protein